MIRKADFYDKLVSYVRRAVPVSVLFCLVGTFVAIAMGTLRTSPLPGYGVIIGTVVSLVAELLRGRSATPGEAETSRRVSIGMAT